MESENGVQVVEDDKKKGVIGMINEEGLVMDTKENDSLNKGGGDLVSNDNVFVSGTATMEEKQTLGSSVGEADELAQSKAKPKPKPKPRNSLSKVSVHANSKINKNTKDQSNFKSPTLLSRKNRPSVTQSLSFPARGSNVDAMKSLDGGSSTKSGAKHAQFLARSKGGETSSTGTGTAGARRRSTLASLPSQTSSSSSSSLVYSFVLFLCVFYHFSTNGISNFLCWFSETSLQKLLLLMVESQRRRHLKSECLSCDCDR